jgi:hypothetical protein
MPSYKVGTSSSVSKVDVMVPPMIATASGR